MRKYNLKLNGKEFEVQFKSLSSDKAHMEINGKDYAVDITSISEVIPEGSLERLRPSAAVSVKAAASTTFLDDGTVIAPIPGSILDIMVEVGEKVENGQALFKMEAMKMENEIRARLSGTVTEIKISVGDTVNQGEVMMLIA